MSIVIAYDLLLSLQEMFGDKGKLARHVALKTIINTRMSKGTPIGDHMISMIKLLNKMEILEAEINEETKVDMVLKTSSASFR